MNSFLVFGAVSGGELLIVLTVIGLPIICGTILLLVLLTRFGRGQKRKEFETDEARLIQELHQGLNRLEKRIESVETILIENERKSERTL